MSDSDQLPTHFVDANDRKWTLRLSYTAYRSCKDFGFDASSDTWAPTIADDPILLGQSLYEMCRAQAEKEGYQDWGSFADAVLTTGDIAADAIDALAGAVINFTHPSRRGMAAKQWILRKAAEKRWEAAGSNPKIDAMIEASIQAVDKRVETILEEAKGKIEAA